jgi:hypothetical protein
LGEGFHHRILGIGPLTGDAVRHGVEHAAVPIVQRRDRLLVAIGRPHEQIAVGLR